jgi:hypothetical protein
MGEKRATHNYELGTGNRESEWGNNNGGKEKG